MKTKVCTKCKIPQNIDQFYVDTRYKDGYYSRCKTCKKKHARENPQIARNWTARNKERSTAIKQAYVETNPEKVKASKSRWAKANNKKMLAKTRKYQASKLNATPKWLSKEQLKDMEIFYINCPKDFHVDHIVPLQGRNVKGLHVPWNLQYLSASENSRKSNKY